VHIRNVSSSACTTEREAWQNIEAAYSISSFQELLELNEAVADYLKATAAFEVRLWLRLGLSVQEHACVEDQCI
jgi:recombinational DNA repair protein (RecF pathway)